MNSELKPSKGVYLISPENIHDTQKFLEDLNFIFSSSKPAIFQLRLKNQKAMEIAKLTLDMCNNYGVLFILNDDIELAKKLQVPVHIGKNDGSLQHTKSHLQIVGVSCYNDVTYAIKMANEGASYVSFGAFFKSPTKPNAVSCNLSVLSEFKKQNLQTKVSAIGGINSLNAKPLINEGADFICVCSSVWNLKTNKDQAEEINKLAQLF